MRLGTVTRSGKAYRVVLAGPFTSTEQATAALAKVRGAGFSKAKISK
jgi:cell division protein FtsN